jgi:hypothetical protein
VVVTATLLATIGWAPEGPLPRRLVPVRLSSAASSGPVPLHPAASRTRTLSVGAVCVLSVPEEGSGRHAAVRVDAAGATTEPVWIAPESDAPGYEILDFLSTRDAGWTVLELIPGPPDRVVARRIARDGTTTWRQAATAGSPEALHRLLEGPTGLLAAAGDRLVAIGDDGSLTELRPLEADGECFSDGRTRIGFVGWDEEREARSWVTEAIDGGERETVTLAPECVWALDVPLGMDAQGRPYGWGQHRLVRIDRAGRIDWELEVRHVAIKGDDVSIAEAPGDFDLQNPRGPAVTADGSIDLATRGPDGVSLVRLTPGA